MKHLILASVLLLSGATAHAQYEVTSVSITNLGTLGGPQSVANDINNNGIIVGWSDDTNEIAQAFYYWSGGMALLDSSFGARTNVANGINNLDEVTGSFVHMGASRGFRLQLGSPFVTLWALSPTRERVTYSAAAIGDSGLIVGQRNFPDRGPTFSEATLWTDAFRFETLVAGEFGTRGRVNDVNIAGDAVGRDMVYDEVALWDRSTGNVASFIPLPPRSTSCGYQGGDLLGINNAGEVVGYYECTTMPGARRHAIYWNRVSSRSVDLGLLPTGTHSIADDINSTGFIVGSANLVTGTTSRESGFLFHPDFGMFALPRSASTLPTGHCRAKALNDRKSNGLIQVIGNCDTAAGSRAVRWNVTVVLR